MNEKGTNYDLHEISRNHKGTSRYNVLWQHLEETSFFTDPASTKYHCNYTGGLHEHSYNVMRNLLLLTEKLNLQWSDSESPRIIGLAHDVCKIGAYLPNDEGGYTHNQDQPKGHGDLSVWLVEKWISLTDEEKACIRWHMGAYDDKENWNKYNEAIHKFPNVLWTHTADMMATHIDEIRKVI